MPYYKHAIIFEKSLVYDANIQSINKGAYLIGYWQDLRYFQHVEDDLRKDLTYAFEASGKNFALLNKIEAESNSVCIHIRRGDYATDDYTIDNVGMCSLEYYYKGIEIVTDKFRDATLYVFSDEPDWVRQNFRPSITYTLVDHNSESNATEDMRLMSACKHCIISNSSFGWWAAWLNSHPDKLVIAPKIWRKNGPDMFTPQAWLKI